TVLRSKARPSPAVPAGQAAVLGAGPDIAAAGFEERQDGVAGQSVRGREVLEAFAVDAKDSVGAGRGPNGAVSRLQHRPDGVDGHAQPLADAIALAAIEDGDAAIVRADPKAPGPVFEESANGGREAVRGREGARS